RDHHAGDIPGRDPVEREQIPNQDAVFVRRLAAVGAQTPLRAQVLSFKNTQHRVRVADVDGEKHAASPLPRSPLGGSRPIYFTSKISPATSSSSGPSSRLTRRAPRSEERRVGKEGRCGWSPAHSQQKHKERTR